MLLFSALLLLFLPQQSHGSVDQETGTLPPRTPPRIVYINDARPYREIRNHGGFQPASRNPSPFGYTLLSIANEAADYRNKSVDTAYVWASATLEAAARRPGRFIYVIHATANMVDMSRSLYNQSIYNADFAALGGIRWSQIIGWINIGNRYHWVKPGEEDMFNGELIHLLHNPKIYWSPGYVSDHYAGQTASGPRPELAGYHAGHAAWEERPWRDIPVSTRHDPELLARNLIGSLVLGTTDRWMNYLPVFKQSPSFPDSKSNDSQKEQDAQKEQDFQETQYQDRQHVHPWRAVRWRNYFPG
ncbi:putative enterotoxin [Ophiocordyceps camponoti-rufipedis]|uniref:Putative enterotoxin n=1 Tax=Ophiocordyceps camponoti-rufipedis TaxID=2004952 RepID=A0A2C5YPJ1_9HYPO|nr:putative enterotoxin [Ophiocordyceps camponoti-rufipedis]